MQRPDWNRCVLRDRSDLARARSTYCGRTADVGESVFPGAGAAVESRMCDSMLAVCAGCAKAISEKAFSYPQRDARAPLESAEMKAQSVGRIIAASMPQGWGFALMMFSVGEGGYSTYVSNLDRATMVVAIRELASKIEKQDLQA